MMMMIWGHLTVKEFFVFTVHGETNIKIQAQTFVRVCHHLNEIIYDMNVTWLEIKCCQSSLGISILPRGVA